MKVTRLLCAFAVLPLIPVTLGLVADGAPPAPHKTPAELGQVHWHDLDAAATRARGSGKPLIVLFQEVPGCSTCVKYGTAVLSHPLIVEAAESCFEPAVVYNNKPGKHANWLRAFSEPAWNNPVVRFMSVEREPLAPRLAGDYSVEGLASSMIAALEKSGAAVPHYLQLLAEESRSRGSDLQRAVFGMHCFWEGERRLGQITGVVGTRAGFMGKEEIVEVEFDPRRVSFEALLEQAQDMQCARKVFARGAQQFAVSSALLPEATVRTAEPIRPDKQPKYYLFNSLYKHVPMTHLQAIRVNAALFNEQDPERFLSPRQLELFAAIQRRPDARWDHVIAPANLALAWSRALALKNEIESRGGH